MGADAYWHIAQSEFLTFESEIELVSVQSRSPIEVALVQFSGSTATADTINLSLGGEYFVADDSTLRAGIKTDRSVASGDFLESGDNCRLDRYHFALGLGVLDGWLETSYGVVYRYGEGEVASRDIFNSGEPRAVPISAHGVMLVLSGEIRTTGGKARRMHELEDKEEATRSRDRKGSKESKPSPVPEAEAVAKPTDAVSPQPASPPPLRAPNPAGATTVLAEPPQGSEAAADAISESPPPAVTTPVAPISQVPAELPQPSDAPLAGPPAVE
ncbi:MAG: hypothetical protein HRU17_08065 [Polyangiaceae bacterium]|nr:hypothetical protein [Polyangiaceae bacterium]